jgi:hypothetical protein
MGSLGNTWFLGGALVVMTAGLPLDAIRAQNQGTLGDWSVVALRENFGVFDSLRLDANGRMELCRFEDGKLLQRKSLEKGQDQLAGWFFDLGAEIQRIAGKRWELPPRPTADSPPFALPKDGPLWTINLIQRDADSARVRRLEGFPKVDSLVNLILNEMSLRSEALPSVSGLLVQGPRLAAETKPNQPEQTGDLLARQLLAAAGTFLPEPYPPDLQGVVQSQDSISSVEAGGLLFTLRRLRP